MSYKQLHYEERRIIGAMKRQGHSIRVIAKALQRSPSTISREIRRNRCRDSYRYSKADRRARTRQRTSRRNKRFHPEALQLVDGYIRQAWSPEQISGTLSRMGRLTISHQTIYAHIWEDERRGGNLFRYLRCCRKRRRKRYRSRDFRGRMEGKRMIGTRPAEIELRNTIGHWEIDTVCGKGSKHCVLTLVERATGFTMIGKLTARTVAEVNTVACRLIRSCGQQIKTITSDNGTEFHGYHTIEKATGVEFYFANPHHSWERGTNENTNGLIRQYLPKGTDMRHVTQRQCNTIAHTLNSRPRKRLGYFTPYIKYWKVA